MKDFFKMLQIFFFFSKRKYNFFSYPTLIFYFIFLFFVFKCNTVSLESYTIYVNKNYTGSISNGAYLSPYKTISAALSNSNITNLDKSIVLHIYEGNYIENISLSNIKRLRIEGGSQPFTLTVNQSFNISDCEEIYFYNVNFVNTNNSSTMLNIDNVIQVNLEKVNIQSAGMSIYSNRSNISISESQITGNTSLDSIYFIASENYYTYIFNILQSDQTIEQTQIKQLQSYTGILEINNSTFTGGQNSIYYISSETNTNKEDPTIYTEIPNGASLLEDIDIEKSLIITNSSISGFSNNGIYAQAIKNINIDNVIISNIAESLENNAGIYLLNSQDGKIINSTISGNGLATDKQNAISLINHDNLYIEYSTLENNSRAGLYVKNSESVIIARSNILNSNRGAWFVSSYADLYATTVDSNILAGVYLQDSFTAIDLSTISNASSGHGIWVQNTTTVNTSYFINNANQIKNNSGNGIKIEGNGFNVTIKTNTFEANGDYAIESDVPLNSDDIFCTSNIFTSGLTIHPNLNGTLCVEE